MDLEDEAQYSKNPWLKIGHDVGTSETLYPRFMKIEGFNFNIVDVGGLSDTGGELIDILVALLNKKIFGVAKKVRFLFPMDYSLITDARGEPIINQLLSLEQIFERSFNKEVAQSILPILTTKGRVLKDEEFDLDEIKTQLEEKLLQNLNKDKYY